MAGRKTTKPAVKAAEAAEVEAIAPKTEEIKAEEKTAEPKAAEKTAEAEKAPAKKAAAKKTTVKKTTAKAEPAAKKTAASGKTEPKSNLHVQFAGRSYAQEDLVRIAKDVWKYDLKRKAGELNSIELYVKPEENKVYYVMNTEFTGSFDI